MMVDNQISEKQRMEIVEVLMILREPVHGENRQLSTSNSSVSNDPERFSKDIETLSLQEIKRINVY